MCNRQSGFTFPKRLLVVLLVFCNLHFATSQNEGMHHGMPQDSTMSMQMEAGKMKMPSMIMLTLPMERDGSGTSWLPDNSPMYAFHNMFGMWNAMLHGELTLRYTAQDAFKSGSRGSSRFSGPNWIMGMLSRPLGTTSQIGFRIMMSLDRLTEGGQGYPLLFQTGESWNGRRLVDDQHPHDLFMELATAYSVRLGEQSTLGVYLAYPGEPALGPPTFMHRPSARLLIDAPLSHHWQDATHISFGVATLGWQLHQVKLEGSIFTGREPDENRLNFDKPTFDSYSARISYNPTDEIALQISRGYLKGPELLEPGVDQLRTTASLLYSHGTDPNQMWSSALVWGMNTLIGDQSQHSLLLESTLGLGRQALFGRFEAVQKSADELDLGSNLHDIYTVLALTVGTSRTVIGTSSVNLVLGIQGTFYGVATDIQPLYGKAPVSVEVFLNLTPAGMHISGSMHKGMDHTMPMDPGMMH
jgi:hypothetical protein